MSRRSTRLAKPAAAVESPREEKEKTRRTRTPAVLRNLAPPTDADDDADDWSRVNAAAAKSTPEKKRKLVANRKKKSHSSAISSGGGGAFSRERAQFLDAQRKFFSDVDLEEVATEQVTVLERRRREDDARRIAALHAHKSPAANSSPGGSAIQPKLTLADDVDVPAADEFNGGAVFGAHETADGAPDDFRLHRGSAKRARRTKLQEKYPVIASTRTDAELQELDYVDAAAKKAKSRSSAGVAAANTNKRKGTQ